MPTASTRIDPSRCPLCGQDNRCAMERERDTGVAQGPCWCVTESFDPALLAQLPEAARGQACICSACLQTFRRAVETPADR
ncbi:cysteine-rich CWC family protein [Hydrogenophaga sp. PAMC20947]|uniref:cysteine-rich CWC family protein n=1 Tax=Hydrogenophaga sp. PAMC20947 TaxID=2565558 RepID=UPI00109DAD28|nr:cysteine-rich CWC family protein [Hydrogenophaga sp. PAMC20947]QCB48007.1 hypothetical protein E5678_19415 [Hydrogenophaga sp. PAMC20947]